MVLPSVAHLSVVFISVIVLCMVFHGEVIISQPSPSAYLFTILLDLPLLGSVERGAPQSRSAILRVLCSMRSSSVFLLSIDLHVEIFPCFSMVVPATVRSASAIGSLTCGSFQHGSLQRGRLPWRARSASQHSLASRSSRFVFFNKRLFPQRDSTWRAFLLSLLLSAFFPMRGSP